MNTMAKALNPYGISYPGLDQQVYWATIRYSRVWLMGDGPRCLEIRRSGIQPIMLRKIAIDYNINRGIVAATDQGDVAAERLCEILMETATGGWPRSLVDRSETCACLTARAINENCFRDFQVSAVTKFMWFLRPRAWTMFDNFAAKGLGVRQNLPAIERMIAFYEKLQQNHYPEIWREMQGFIDDNGSVLSGLPAPRITDTLLMARGGRGADDNATREARRLAMYFLGLLPQGMAVGIHETATKLQQNFPDERLGF